MTKLRENFKVVVIHEDLNNNAPTLCIIDDISLNNTRVLVTRLDNYNSYWVDQSHCTNAKSETTPLLRWYWYTTEKDFECLS